MKTICFYPWINLDADVALPDGSALVPYQRGRKPFGNGSPAQRAADAVLFPYRTRFDFPIDEAVLWARNQQDVFAEIDEPDLQQIRTVSEYLAFDALARRHFFSQPRSYCSRGHFRLVVQTFNPDDPTTVATVTRRRDGRSLAAWSVADLHEQMPAHLRRQYQYVPDEQLVHALWATRSDEDLLDALCCFNQANTDSTDFPASAEITLLVSAFERIVHSEPGKVSSFKKGFLDLAMVEPSIPCSEFPSDRRASYEKTKRRARTILEVWLEDLFALRGNTAHGKNPERYRAALWTIHEHLLLATFAFPPLVGRRLEGSGVMAFRESDSRCLTALESLLQHENLLAPALDSSGQRCFAWNELLMMPSEARGQENLERQLQEPENEEAGATNAG